MSSCCLCFDKVSISTFIVAHMSRGPWRSSWWPLKCFQFQVIGISIIILLIAITISNWLDLYKNIVSWSSVFWALQLRHNPLLSILSLFDDNFKLLTLLLLSCTVRLTLLYMSTGTMGDQVMMLFPLYICSVPWDLLWSWLLPHIQPCGTHNLLKIPCLFLLILIYSPRRMLLWYLLYPTINLVSLWHILGSNLSITLPVLILPVYMPILMM